MTLFVEENSNFIGSHLGLLKRIEVPTPEKVMLILQRGCKTWMHVVTELNRAYCCLAALRSAGAYQSR